MHAARLRAHASAPPAYTCQSSLVHCPHRTVGKTGSLSGSGTDVLWTVTVPKPTANPFNSVRPAWRVHWQRNLHRQRNLHWQRTCINTSSRLVLNP